jgi:hypothetical protein
MTDEMQSFVDFQRSENALFSGFYLTCSGWQVDSWWRRQAKVLLFHEVRR